MLDKATGVAAELFRQTRWFRELGLDTQMLKMLLSLECRKNREFLRPILRADIKSSQDDPIYLYAASMLETDAMAALLSLDDRAYKAFRQLGKVPMMKKEWDGATAVPAGNSDDGVDSAAARMQALYVSICTVRSLADIWSTHPELVEQSPIRVYFKTRLRNIDKTLARMEHVLTTEK